MPKAKDWPLRLKIENSQLVIRIGIDTLAHSAEHCPLFYDDEQLIDLHRCGVRYDSDNDCLCMFS